MMNICTAVNTKYAHYLAVMLASLMDSNIQDEINIYILYSDLTDESKTELKCLVEKWDKKIAFVKVDSSRLSQKLPTTMKFSQETYFRLFMPELLPEVDRILYLDVDITVIRPLRDLYDTSFDGCYTVACTDMLMPAMNEAYKKRFGRKGDFRYFNAGVMVWDLEKVRKDFCFDDFMGAAEKLNYEMPNADQEIINYLFEGKIKELDAYRYNYMPLSVIQGLFEPTDINDVSIIHFAARNPWNIGAKSGIYKKWWINAKKTPFYEELLEEHIARLEEYFYSEKSHEEQEDEQRQITEALFREAMSHNLKIRASSKISRLGIYGAGFLANLLFEVLEHEGIDNVVEAVVDKNKLGLFHEVEVMRDFRGIAGDWLFVVTPSYETKRLISKLKSEVPKGVRLVSMRDFLRGDGEKW